MPHRFFKTIRARLTITIMCFTFILLLVFAALTFKLFSAEQRGNLIRSTEFNLQLVAGMIDKDIDKLKTLSQWSTSSANMTGFLRDKSATKFDSLNAHTRLMEEHRVNSAAEYVRRLVVYGGDEKLLQVGNATTSDTQIVLYWMRYNLQRMSERVQDKLFVGADTLSLQEPQALLMMRPILLADGEKGLSYMAISLDIFFKRLENYGLLKDDKLYLSIEGKTYLIGQKALTEIQSATFTLDEKVTTMNKETLCSSYVGEDKKSHSVISYPIKSIEGGYISQSIENGQFSWRNSGYDVLMLTLGGLIIVIGIILALYMHKIINNPVNHIRKRLDIIAKGNFERDDTIEWNNELGDIGRGINALSRDIVQLMDNRLKNENEKRALEYKMLQNQINPHFIYNTLNSIKWMATIQNATGIAEMTTAFSRLLKSVAKGNEELITLREEFALLNDYCIIQQYRYGGSITLEIAEISNEDLCECLIPRFTLQPLAENAIFHGIEPKGGVGSIWLHIVQAQDGILTIAMQDDGVGMSEQTIAQVFDDKISNEGEKFKQIGIRNVHQRIRFAFGEEYGIQIFSKLGSFTRMEIRIPCKKKQIKEDGNV